MSHRMRIIHNIIGYTLLAIFLWTMYKLVSLVLPFDEIAETTSAVNDDIVVVR